MEEGTRKRVPLWLFSIHIAWLMARSAVDVPRSGTGILQTSHFFLYGKIPERELCCDLHFTESFATYFESWRGLVAAGPIVEFSINSAP